MSFDIGMDDLRGPNQPWPEKVKFVGTIQEATVDTSEKGTQCVVEIGSITANGQSEVTQQDGSTFNIGNRIQFVRLWWDHQNPKAAQAGHGQLASMAIALGLMQKPEKGQRVPFPYETAEATMEAFKGKAISFQIKNEGRKDKTTKEPVLDDDGQQIIDSRPGRWEAAS